MKTEGKSIIRLRREFCRFHTLFEILSELAADIPCILGKKQQKNQLEELLTHF
jgi:hypothetical protein